MSCRAAEQAARGKAVSPELFDAVSEAAAGEVNPRTSWRASRAFRMQLVRELSRRALKPGDYTCGRCCDMLKLIKMTVNGKGS